MDERVIMELVKEFDETMFIPYFDKTKKESVDLFNATLKRGVSKEQALIETISIMSYLTLKKAIFLQLLININFDPDKPKTKEELKGLLSVIQGGLIE